MSEQMMEQTGFPSEGEIFVYITERAEFPALLGSLGLTEISKDEMGAPYLKDLPYHVSLSHKGDLQVFAISKEKVGVDLEDVTVPRNVERLSRFFHTAEKPQSLYEFYLVWTAKEAVGKMLGTGVTKQLLASHTEGVRHFDHGDYVIAVAGVGEITLKERE